MEGLQGNNARTQLVLAQATIVMQNTCQAAPQAWTGCSCIESRGTCLHQMVPGLFIAICCSSVCCDCKRSTVNLAPGKGLIQRPKQYRGLSIHPYQFEVQLRFLIAIISGIWNHDAGHLCSPYSRLDGLTPPGHREACPVSKFSTGTHEQLHPGCTGTLKSTTPDPGALHASSMQS